MANVNDKIFDRIVEHMSDVRLYEEGQQILQRRIIRRHRENLTKLLKKDIRSDVTREVNRFAKELNSSTTNSIKEFSTSQIDFHTDNLYREVKDFYKMRKPTTKELLSEITGTGMRGEKSLSGNVRNIASGELIRIQSRVRSGLAYNKSPKEIIADVMKTTKLTEHQASTLTRTAITSTQTAALNKVVQENKDVIKGYMFTAILDSRTSPICSHHNGKIYDVDDNRFMPPLHWNCRSSLVPVLKSKEELANTGNDNISVFGEQHTLKNVGLVERRVEKFNPSVVYHEFYEDPETIAWAKKNNFILRKGDLSYAEKDALVKKYGGATEQFHRDREAFMYNQMKNADKNVRTAFIMGNDHAFDSGSVIFKDKSFRKVDYRGKVFEASTRIQKSKLEKIADTYFNGLSAKIQTFTEWLRKQDFDTMVKMLGSEERAKLFKGGALEAREFITPKGTVLSIQALRARASKITSVFRPRQVVKDTNLRVEARNPNSLLNNPKHQSDLEQLFISDADDYNSAFALTDFKGTSLVGKQASRRRMSNQFDERNFITDTFTGEVRSNLTYEPDFNLFQERLDFMKSAKDLTSEQKDFIEGLAIKLTDKVSVNQQIVAVENLRVTFQRYNSSKEPWSDLASVIRAENRFSVQNVSRLLDVRARKRAELFGGFVSTGDKPKMQIMGKYYNVEDLVNDQLSNQRFIDNWRATEGTKLAKKVYYRGRAPINAYTQAIIRRYPDKEKLIDKMLDNVIPFRKQYKAYLKWKNKPPSDDWITRQIAKFREGVRQIYDLEWLYAKQRPTSKLMDDKVLHTTTKALKLVASGRATDYDSLAINIGKMYHQDLGDLNPLATYTLKDYHKEGSKILEFMREQNLIRVSFRGKTRRGVWDVDTGRASGGWADTITREVQVIDKTLLKLQEAELKATYARRFGVVYDRDRLYVKAGNKEFFDARGNKTGIPIISADKYPDYDPNQIDAEMAKMMNHVTSVNYRVDDEFFDFMDDVVRFRDPRGNTKYYDELNEFRHEIINRGEAGYGLMATAKYHRQRGKSFKTDVFIDSRGRVYHRGYLTPTGGEMVRPFLNSDKAVAIQMADVNELRIQLGAMIGPGTEALTQSGRLDIFKRNESKILELAGLLQAKTQRDRRIREFLEHPLIKGLEGKEVPKMARFALEYKRIHDHVGGNFSNTALLKTYKTRLMIENDASSSGAQIIGLSTGDRAIAEASNVVATTRKNRLYDLVAQDTVNDPEFLKIPALRNAGLTWEDLAKGAKAQNMVTFYGAGEATKTANIANKLSGILEKKGYATITKDNVNEILRIVDGKIKTADKLGANATVDSLKSFRSELIEMVNGNTPVGRNLLTMARDLHPDVEDFVLKVSNSRVGLVGPKDFEEISRIMSKHLSQRAPVTDEFINFWKSAAKVYVKETEKVDIPWVTFDGKVMMQRYRGKSQTRIDFTDPVTGRKIANIYEGTVEDGLLRGKHAFQDASIGLGVNGNHSNDAVIVRRFHLWGRDNGVDTGTIHDAFFTNLADAQKAKDALRTIYADALEGDTIRKTLYAWRKEGLTKSAYDALIADAKKRGLIDPPNKLTRADILAPIKEGYDWYGIGP
jgi:SPP1 gp7 family putative phage head morphogenesis protein